MAVRERLEDPLELDDLVFAEALGTERSTSVVLVGGLIAFGVIFALNSAVHSYLILAYAEGDKVAMNVGFYYMANAGGLSLLLPRAQPSHAASSSSAPGTT